MTVPAELARAVRARAAGRCQYCLMHESLQGASFHVEHVIPRSKGGRDVLDNLVLACPGCNLRKTSRTMAMDSKTGERVQLFHPLCQTWQEHFRLNGFQIEGLTDVGRATVEALDMNHPRRLRIREVEERFGLYPPVF
ncbi:MAG: HNH endonuclease [Verrucomicrobia bacterium]|nr:MAG: HNH endonuclease [Verrucomicrobiota bacterium]